MIEKLPQYYRKSKVVKNLYDVIQKLLDSENCKWRKRRNFEQGIAYDFRVYGYDMVDKKLVINKEQAAVVKTIFDMYVGGYGSKIIADTLFGSVQPIRKKGKSFVLTSKSPMISFVT